SIDLGGRCRTGLPFSGDKVEQDARNSLAIIDRGGRCGTGLPTSSDDFTLSAKYKGGTFVSDRFICSDH
ncbi:hypothetical protein, partial [Klebsiella variicola]